MNLQTQLRQILAIHFFMPKLYLSQCNCYVKLKKGDEALASCGKVLELEPDCSLPEIRKAYRKLALEWHPDKHTDKETAETKFVEINEAYEVLSDEEKRRRYDSGEDLDEQPHFHNPFGGGFGGFGGGGPFHFNFNFG